MQRGNFMELNFEVIEMQNWNIARVEHKEQVKELKELKCPCLTGLIFTPSLIQTLAMDCTNFPNLYNIT